jgi:hypothetical protein
MRLTAYAICTILVLSGCNRPQNIASGSSQTSIISPPPTVVSPELSSAVSRDVLQNPDCVTGNFGNNTPAPGVSGQCKDVKIDCVVYGQLNDADRANGVEQKAAVRIQYLLWMAGGLGNKWAITTENFKYEKTNGAWNRVMKLGDNFLRPYDCSLYPGEDL